MTKEVKKVFSRIGFSYALYWGTTMFAQTMLMVVMSSWLKEASSSGQGFRTGITMLVSMMTMYVFGFPAFWLVIRKIPISQRPQEEKWSIKKLGTIFLICLSVIYIGNIIGTALMYGVGVVTGNPIPNTLATMIRMVHPGIIFLLTVIAAPIMEELIFRKMLIDRILSYGEGVTILMSGLIFGLAHGNFYQFFYAFALGSIFAYIYIKTGKIWYTIAFHMIINFCGSMIPIFLLKMIEKQLLIGGLFAITFYLFILGFIVLGIWLLIKNRKQISIRPGLISKGGEVGYKPVFLNLGMATYLVVCLILFALGS